MGEPAAAAAAATAPEVVRALFDYTGDPDAEEKELSFKVGQMITATDTSDPDWFEGHVI